jgi:hypothetical protein
MSQHRFGDDDEDLSDVLNFSGDGGSATEDDDVERPAAWDFSVTADDGGEESAVDAMPACAAAEPEGPEAELDAIRSVVGPTGESREDDEDAVPLLTVTNPPGKVSVSVLRDGGIDRVGLSAKATTLTESQLAEEILVSAHLARQKGQAARHAFLLDAMREVGEDDTAALRDLLEDGMHLTSPEQAETAQAQVFATRYGTDR